MSPIYLTNTRVYTMDHGKPTASAILIQDGAVKTVLDGPQSSDPPSGAEVIDLGGKTVLPGLIDAHLHLRQYAETLQIIDCETETKQECLERVRATAQNTPPGEWILGHGWNHNSWSGEYGTAGELDAITDQHPVYLTGKSLHVSWANSLGLKAGKITSGTPDPPDGLIERDNKGKPTGILFENGVKLIENQIPKPDLGTTIKNIRRAQEELLKLGITGVHDFDRELCLHALQELNQSGGLNLRVCKSIPRELLEGAIQQGYQTGSGNDWLWFGGVKLFSDGALGPQTAAMLQPYENTEEIGLLLLSEEELFEIGCRAAKNGLALSVHAIGDLANRTVLNALEGLRQYEKDEGISPLPHRIEHVQLIHPDDIHRLAKLEVTASMQPIHATSDMEMADKYWGPRTKTAYAPKLQFEAGALVAFGSDAPVESPNPWWGIHAAVSRRRADGSPGPEGWHPEGRITLTQALGGFTTNAAKAGGRGDVQGRLVPGSWADLIVLDSDPFSSFSDELRELAPAGVMVNGAWIIRNF